MKTRLVLVLAALLLAPALTLSATRISIGTGSSGGVYFFVGNAMTSLLNKHMAGLNATPEPVTGSAHASKLVDSGDLALALAEVATAYHGYRGSRKDFPKPLENIRFVMGGMASGQAPVVWADSPIKSWADIKGKRIATNSPASLAMVTPLLEMHGIEMSDVDHKTLNYTEQVSAMKDGNLDVAFMAPAPRNASVMDLGARRAIRILGLAPDTAKEYARRYPHWSPITLKAGTYDGQKADVIMPAYHTAVIANKDVDADLIYGIVKTVIEHNKEFGEMHESGKEFTVERTRDFLRQEMVPAPFHPGAERFWREKGVVK
ncbi:MAG TPA: TAXI family TRAP transporter solute-binding subunit [Thermodesulfobacteriota bacterium]